MAVAGIHFGNTNSVISVCKDGRVETVSNETGDRVTPTIVAYTGTEKVVGQPAKQYLIRNPLSCISHIKSSIGQSFTDEHIKQIKDGFSCKMSNDNGTISFKLNVNDNDVSVSSIDAASYIFTKLLEIAELVGGSDLEDVVLAVPHSFSEEQRISLCEAAENIGCNILRLISEPAAALLAYGVGQVQEDSKKQCHVLVFRVGGSSTDATVMKVTSGMYRFINQKVNPKFGSKDFDKVLVDSLVQEFKRKFKEDLSENKRAIGKLKMAAEECKHGLSRMEHTMCAVDSLYDGIDFHTQVIRAKFELITGHLYTKCIQLVDDLLLDCGLTEKQIDKVIFVGGGMYIPRLVNIMKERFSSSEILNNIPPEEVLAQGAAIQAGLLQGREDIILNSVVTDIDCISKNIGIKVVEENKETLDVVIEKCVPVPVRRSKTFKTDYKQTSAYISIYESEDNNLDTAKLLAKIVMKDLPSDQEKEFLLHFEINRSGILLATLSEKYSDRTEQVTIEMET